MLAIDGSKAEVPNSKENREVFGVSASQYLKQCCVRALVNGMYDILNGFYLNIQIVHYE